MLKPEEYLRPDVIGQIKRFDLKAKFIMRGYLAGMHATLNKGFSVEFSDHRRYVPGDDTRAIDWNVLARTQRYYIRRYQAESTLDTHLLIDSSASMGYCGPGSTMTKHDYAICVAAALAWLMIHQQDPVGLFHARPDTLDRLPAKTGRRHLFHLLAALSAATPDGVVDIVGAMTQTARRVSHRGLIVILSDILEEPERFETGLALLRHKGHDVIVFHIVDAAEWRLDFDGMSIFRDPETHEEIVTDPDIVRDDYLKKIHAHAHALHNICNRHRADYVMLDTALPFDTALTAYLNARSGA